jgi:uncharacterized protein (AIM24 family)
LTIASASQAYSSGRPARFGNTGPGRIWLQSMPLSNLAHALSPYLGGGGVKDAAAGGAVGGIIGDMLRG